MNVKISERMAGLNPSTIREMHKYTSKPGVISFAAGGPSPEMYPVREMAAIAAELFESSGPALFQYGTSEGFPPLREALRARLLEKYGAGRDYDDLIVVHGGQQVIDLTCKCLCNEGDTVICESPSFIGALNTFRSYRLKLAGIPMDSGGMDMDALETALKTEKNVRFIYTIPDFQNPMGVTLTLERRRRLYELACRYDVMILEDNPYFELRYTGPHVPLIKSLDTEGRVIFAGSVSKVIAPGLRVGYLLAQEELVKKMVVAKQIADVHTNLPIQMFVDSYIRKYDLDAHIGEAIDLYKRKRDCMISRIRALFPPEISCTEPNGGLFIWFDMPEGLSGSDFTEYALKKNVACVPGATFDLAEDRRNRGVRMNFTVPSFEQIERGIEILAGCIGDFLKK